jgi:uncharacterized membrane protein YdbT with pleckstrin-like domain
MGNLAVVPYSDFMLRDNEDLVLDLHPHWWYFAKAVLTIVVAVLLGGYALTLGKTWDPLKVVSAVLIIGALVWLGERYIRWISTHFILTTDRVIWREGVIAKKGIEIPLQRINTILFSQGIVERILGLGDLTIESASETGAQIFEDIRSPAKVQHEIYSQMETNENRGLDKLGDRITAQAQAPAQPPAAPPQSVTDQIAELHGLHEAGALTDAEYESKKAELLRRM